MRTSAIRTITGVVAADGSLTRATDPRVSTSRTGTGAYQLRMPADARMIGFAATVFGPGAINASGVTASGATLGTFNTVTAASLDTGWCFTATVTA